MLMKIKYKFSKTMSNLTISSLTASEGAYRADPKPKFNLHTLQGKVVL